MYNLCYKMRYLFVFFSPCVSLQTDRNTLPKQGLRYSYFNFTSLQLMLEIYFINTI